MNRHRVARACGALAAPLVLLAMPQAALGHQLSESYEAPLPLAAYVVGAALAVAMSFLFVMVRNAPAHAAAADAPAPVGKPRTLPAWLRYGLKALGLIAWLWIVAQTLFGGSGDGDVGSLFLWVYGWVGLALLSALVGPVWPWLNPFATIHQILSALADRVGIRGGEPAIYPARLARWPAVVGFLVVVWLELVLRVEGGQQLGMFLIGYTFVSLVAMAYFGRDAWLAQGETFSVWFDVLGRLPAFALDGRADDGVVVRRPFASGLLFARWTSAELVLLAVATGAIIFDGLSQTQVYFDLLILNTPLGTDPAVRESITATIFLGAIVLAVIGVARLLSVRAVAAGLLPVAVGYLVAHYLTYLLVDGQRLVLALNDPLQRGDNLLPGNLGFFEPSSPLPTSIVWTIQLAAVVGGHIVGAWAGHSVLAQDDAAAVQAGAGGTGTADGAVAAARSPVMRQLPLAVLMVCLTSVTLWSLGQAVIVTAPPTG
jgi:hypothetical protein